MRNSRRDASASARGADAGAAPTPGAADSFRVLLGGLAPRTFLRRHWQKRPRLVRGAIPGFRGLLGKDELFRLACRDDVESRLVLERGGDYPWQVLHGPFRPRDLRGLPRRHWTLLVQKVDLHLRAGAELLRRFSFIPDWRIDDLMISYAPPGASVGAHVDSYDVFLLQGPGRRRWRIDARPHGEEDFIPGLDLRIIGRFRPQRQWRLSAGDMLYLPPGVAHHGIAEDECMTYSIGFRAPSGRELAQHFLEAHGGDERRYRDPDLRAPAHPGEIDAAARTRLRTLMRGAIEDAGAFEHWLGCFLTTLPEGVAAQAPRRRVAAPAFRRAWRAHGMLERTHPTRALYLRGRDGIVLFVNGEGFRLPRDAAPLAAGYTQDWRMEWPRGRRAPDAPVLRTLRRMHDAGLLSVGAARRARET